LFLFTVALSTNVIESALLQVSPFYRISTIALGISKLRVIWKVVLPETYRFLVLGTVLVLSRLVSESSPFLLTMTNSSHNKKYVLSTKIWELNKQGNLQNEIYFLTFLIIILLFLFNFCLEQFSERRLVVKK
jgi:ABC-type phosphate transport system permease subunit